MTNFVMQYPPHPVGTRFPDVAGALSRPFLTANRNRWFDLLDRARRSLARKAGNAPDSRYNRSNGSPGALETRPYRAGPTRPSTSRNLGVEKTDTLIDVGVYRVVGLGEVTRGKEGVTNMFHVVLADGIGKYRKQILNAEA